MVIFKVVSWLPVDTAQSHGAAPTRTMCLPENTPQRQDFPVCFFFFFITREWRNVQDTCRTLLTCGVARRTHCLHSTFMHALCRWDVGAIARCSVDTRAHGCDTLGPPAASLEADCWGRVYHSMSRTLQNAAAALYGNVEKSSADLLQTPLRDEHR